MKHKCKRILALLLAMTMMMSMFVTAYAETPADAGGEEIEIIKAAEEAEEDDIDSEIEEYEIYSETEEDDTDAEAEDAEETEAEDAEETEEIIVPVEGALLNPDEVEITAADTEETESGTEEADENSYDVTSGTSGERTSSGRKVLSGGVINGSEAEPADLEPVTDEDGNPDDGSSSNVTIEPVDRATLDVNLTRLSSEESDLEESVLSTAIQFEPADTVRVMIVLDDPAVVEADSSADILSTYSASQISKLEKKQAAVITAIEDEVLDGEDLDVSYQFTWLINAVSAEVPFGTIDDIEELDGVKDVYVEELYYPAEDTEPESTGSPLLSTSGEMIDREAVWAAGYTGEGMKVAIIDTGIDTTHVNFQEMDESVITETSATEESVTEVLPYLNSYSIYQKVYGGTLTASQVYRSNKIAYGFNYIDETLNITHNADSQGDHGTHVAGIVAANDVNDVKGVAYNAQLYVMKVFGAYGGAYSSDIVAALEDAAMLGADAVNMSLGGTAGFSTAGDPAIDSVYETIGTTDLVLAVAAGNETTFGLYNLKGHNANTVDNPDNGVVSSPATYSSAVSVASVDNIAQKNYYIQTQDGYQMVYTEGSDGGNDPMSTLFGETLEYVMVPGYGEATDFEGLDLTGKVAVVSRGGGVNFSVKMVNAQNAGAVACLVYNNTSGSVGADLSDNTTGTIPFATITKAAGEHLQALYDEAQEEGRSATIYFGTEMTTLYGESYEMSSFTSWGTTSDLHIEPDITAPGGSIYSTTDKSTYDSYSGTSMATPQIAGMSALVMEYIRDTEPDVSISDSDLATALLMSTATPVTYADLYCSPRQQGNGLANVYDAITSSAYIQVAGTNEPQIELGDDPEKTGSYSYTFDVVNFGDNALYYDIFTSIQTEDYAEYEDGLYMASLPVSLSGATSASGSSVILTYDYDESGLVHSHDARELYLTMDSVDLANEMFRYDLTGNDGVEEADVQAYLDALVGNNDFDLDAQVFCVKAGETESVRISVQVSDSGKAWMDTYYPNGIYVEGFTVLTAMNGVDLTIPYLAFYGDWGAVPMFDGGYWWMEEDEWTEKSNQYYNILWTTYMGYEDYWYPGVNPYVDEIYDPENLSLSPNGDGNVDYISDIYASMMRNSEKLTVTYADADDPDNVYQSETFDHVSKSYYSSTYGLCVPFVLSLYTYDYAYGCTDADGNVLENNSKIRLTVSADLEGNGEANETWEEIITVDTETPELDESYGILSVDTIDGSQYLTIRFRDNVNVAAVSFVSPNGMIARAQYLVDHDLKDEDGWITETFDITGVGNRFYVILSDYALNESAWLFTTTDNNPVMDESLLYGFRVSDENYYNDYLFGWLSIDPKTGESTVLDSEYYIDYAIEAAVYVDGYVIAAAADKKLYAITPGLWDEWTYIADLTYSGSDVEIYCMAYDPVEKVIWAVGKSGSSGSSSRIFKIDILSGELDRISSSTGLSGLSPMSLMCDDNGNLYMITSSGMLRGVNKSTGAGDTSIINVNLREQLGLDDSTFANLQSAVYNSEDGCFYWAAYTSVNVPDADRYGKLVRIKIDEDDDGNATATATMLDTIQGNAEIVGLLMLQDRSDFKIPVTSELDSLSIQSSDIKMLVGNTRDLNAEATPWYADGYTLRWNSSNDQVATVNSSGKVTAVGLGEAIITVTDGTISDSINVNVVEVNSNLIGFSVMSSKDNIHYQWIDFNAGEVSNYTTLTEYTDFAAYMLSAGDYVNGYLYAYDATGEFYRIDPETYAVVRLGSYEDTRDAEFTRLDTSIYDMAYCPYDGNLYALVGQVDSSGNDITNLCIVDTLTGELSVVVNNLWGNNYSWPMAIAFDKEGALYFVATDGCLYYYDLFAPPLYATFKNVGELDTTVYGYCQSMAFDYSTEDLYWSSWDGMYLIDKETGVALPMGTVDGSTQIVCMYCPDSVNDIPNPDEAEDVTSVEVISDTVTVMEGMSAGLPLSIEPWNATNRYFEWTIADPSVARIEEGVVYGLKSGKTTAVGTLTTSDGNKFSVDLTIKVPASVGDIYGWVAWDNLSTAYCYWGAFTDNDLAAGGRAILQPSDYVVSAGTYYNGKIYGYDYSNKSLIVVDAENFILEKSLSYSDQELMDMTFDYTTGTFYAIAANTNADAESTLVVVDFEKGKTYSIGQTSDYLYTLAASPKGILYAISARGNLYTIDKKTAELTYIGNTGYEMNESCSMTFDRDNGNLYWAQSYIDYETRISDFLLVDPENGSVTKLGKISTLGCKMGCLFTIPSDESVPTTVTPDLIILSKTEEGLLVGDSFTLTATLVPLSTNTSEIEFTYSSSDTSVATVSSDGLVKAVGTGTATITVSLGTLSAMCKVTIIGENTSFYVMNPTGWEISPIYDPKSVTAGTTYPSSWPEMVHTAWSDTDQIFYSTDEDGILYKYDKNCTTLMKVGDVISEAEKVFETYHNTELYLVDLVMNPYDNNLYAMVRAWEYSSSSGNVTYVSPVYRIYMVDKNDGEITLASYIPDYVWAKAFVFTDDNTIITYNGSGFYLNKQQLSLDTNVESQYLVWIQNSLVVSYYDDDIPLAMEYVPELNRMYMAASDDWHGTPLSLYEYNLNTYEISCISAASYNADCYDLIMIQ